MESSRDLRADRGGDHELIGIETAQRSQRYTALPPAAAISRD